MTLGVHRAAQLVALALAITVVTQIVYVWLGGGGHSEIAYPIWRLEALCGLAVALFSFRLLARHPLVGGALVAAGIWNVIQVGMGLTMFYQSGYGGEGPPQPHFFPILSMSFFLYFAAKAALGTAAIALSIVLWDGASGVFRLLGLITALAGLTALLLNGWAMMMGMGIVYIAGGAGTVATLLVALTLPLTIGRK